VGNVPTVNCFIVTIQELTEHLMSKMMCHVGFLLFTFAVLVWCAPAAAQDAPAAWVCPPGYEGQTLNVFNWSTYIAEDTVSNFEAACGVSVNYDVYESDDGLVTRLRQGNPGYDIVVPGEPSAAILIRENLLLPLDFSKIPNYANIGAAYKNTIFDPENQFTVPYLTGTAGLGYNQKAVGEAITSWEQFFNYKGQVAWVEDTRWMMTLGLLMSGHTLNSDDPQAIQDAGDYLIAHGDNVSVIAGDDGQELLARGEVDMVIEYSGDIYQLTQGCGCDDFVYVLPEEGSSFLPGFVSVPVGAQNPALANVFIDYLLDPQVAADIATYTAYPTPNQAAIDAGLIDPALLANPGIYPDEATLKRLFYIVIPPDAEQLYSDAWDEVKIAISR
jgi:spermidine/putrescine transport system substrate-binding protein